MVQIFSSDIWNMWPLDHNMGEEDGGSTMALKFLLPEVTHVTVTHSDED